MTLLRIRITRSWAWILLLLAGLLPVHAVADEIFESCPVAQFQSHGHESHDVHEDTSHESCHQHCSLAPPVTYGRDFVDRQVVPVLQVSSPLELRISDRCATANSARHHDTPPIDCSSAFHTGVGLRLYA